MLHEPCLSPSHTPTSRILNELFRNTFLSFQYNYVRGWKKKWMKSSGGNEKAPMRNMIPTMIRYMNCLSHLHKRSASKFNLLDASLMISSPESRSAHVSASLSMIVCERFYLSGVDWKKIKNFSTPGLPMGSARVEIQPSSGTHKSKEKVSEK